MIDQPNSASTTETSANACPVKRDGSSLSVACDAAPYRLPQFTLQFLALATVLVAVWASLWPITSVGSRAVLAVIVLTYLFGCARTRRTVLLMLPAFYVPQLFAFLVKGQAQRLWSEVFWLMPGQGAAITIIIWLFAVTIGRRGGVWLWATVGVAFIVSGVCTVMERMFPWGQF